MSHILFSPDTDANQELRRQVAPSDWKNPTPDGTYNLVVVGAGSGGLVSAVGAAGLGAKVALVERHALGGDCLNVGCVPSKALLSAAKTAATVRRAGAHGVNTADVKVDFPAMMERMRRLRARIAPNDSAERLRSLGVDVYLGEGVFTDERTIAVGDRQLRFSKAVIATGARAVVPPLPGLAEAEPLTNESVFSLTELPRRLAILGAGPIGCEMAQAFARFGSEVHLFEKRDRILPKDDAEAAEVVQHALEEDGVRIHFGAKMEAIHREGKSRQIVSSKNGTSSKHEVDEILVGMGRAPNVEGLGLEAAGVRYDARTGVEVDAHLRTSNRRVFAVGDACLKLKFTHTADATARLVIQNALFKGRKRHTDLLVPWCTYTSPELAHVGVSGEEARERHGDALQTFTQSFAESDRAIVEGDEAGFARIHAVKGRIVGATIVGAHAGELISEVSVAMRAGMKLGDLAGVIHPYPTLAEAVRKTGDAYKRTQLTPLVEKLFHRWLAWTR